MHIHMWTDRQIDRQTQKTNRAMHAAYTSVLREALPQSTLPLPQRRKSRGEAFTDEAPKCFVMIMAGKPWFSSAPRRSIALPSERQGYTALPRTLGGVWARKLQALAVSIQSCFFFVLVVVVIAASASCCRAIQALHWRSKATLLKML